MSFAVREPGFQREDYHTLVEADGGAWCETRVHAFLFKASETVKIGATFLASFFCLIHCFAGPVFYNCSDPKEKSSFPKQLEKRMVDKDKRKNWAEGTAVAFLFKACKGIGMLSFQDDSWQALLQIYNLLLSPAHL